MATVTRRLLRDMREKRYGVRSARALRTLRREAGMTAKEKRERDRQREQERTMESGSYKNPLRRLIDRVFAHRASRRVAARRGG